MENHNKKIPVFHNVDRYFSVFFVFVVFSKNTGFVFQILSVFFKKIYTGIFRFFNQYLPVYFRYIISIFSFTGHREIPEFILISMETIYQRIYNSVLPHSTSLHIIPIQPSLQRGIKPIQVHLLAFSEMLFKRFPRSLNTIGVTARQTIDKSTHHEPQIEGYGKNYVTTCG